MRSRHAVPTALLLLCLGACHVRAGYGGWGGYSTSYGSSGVVYNEPTAPAPPPPVATTTVAAPAPAAQGPLGAEVQGSDGTFGWRATGDEAMFTRANEALVRFGCRVDSAQPTETLAECAGGVKLLLRRDPSHVYRLCATGTDRAQCLTTWTQIGGR